jgi:hypothetical protein
MCRDSDTKTSGLSKKVIFRQKDVTRYNGFGILKISEKFSEKYG